MKVEGDSALLDEKLQKIKQIVEKELSCSAHDMDHVMRVYKICLEIAKHEENVDFDVLKAAALLHDIARVKEYQDSTGSIDHAVLGAEMAEKILENLGYPEEKIEKIKHCIISHRFRSSIKPRTIEAKILSDADKLDVLGAIGIARSFMIAGHWGQKMYLDVPLEDYVRENVVNGRIKDIRKHAPNLEFELKFKYIPGKLYTKRAKEIAKERMRFMEEFFRRLKEELEGRA